MLIEREPQYTPASVGSLSGRTALVTGGTRGIGRGISLALAAAGAIVLVTGRDERSGAEVARIVREAGGEAHVLAADLYDDAAVDALVPLAVDRVGRLDILVNNAGIDADAPAIDYALDDWRRVLRMNLEVPFRLAKAAAQHFGGHGGGAIINVTSVLASVATPEAASYVAAKHGLAGLTKVLAIEWAKQGVRVNAVAPGLIQTDMTKVVWEGDHGGQYVANRIPLGRIGQPRDIGGVVVFLASDAAGFIHGETIVADGGFLAT